MLLKKEKLEALINRWRTDHGKELLQTIKKSHLYLNRLLFKEKMHHLAGIKDPEVEDGIDLRGTHMSGFDFRIKVPDEDGEFSEDIALLSSLHFEGATLKHCNFEGGRIHNCHFENTNLSHAEFKNSTLNNCWFQEADLTGINLQGAKLVNCDFRDCIIKDVDFTSTIVDQRTDFGAELRSEKEKNYNAAAIEHKQLKEMYRNSSLHDDADEHHYQSLVTKRKSLPKTSVTRFISYLFGDLLCKYGISFTRVFLWSATIILGCAVLYDVSGSLYHFKDNLLFMSFSDSIYFSIITFSTLGYGDFLVVGPTRFVAGIESLTGMVLMALFAVIAGRIIIRD